MPVPEMFRVKICGLTDFENAIAVAHSGADAIGLNFYSGSKRRVEPATAEKIANSVRGEVQIVGLFVNATHDEIMQTQRRVGFDWIQLHGDESREFAETIHNELDIPILAASRGTLLRWGTSGEGFQPQAVLMDAAVAGEFGGTGQQTDWQLAATWRSQPQLTRFVLAGGLTPENVAEAIRMVQPSAIDVAGGVEISGKPGIKDMGRVEALVSAAQSAFARIESS
ncbi:phosphoribosylanthranilate isomerase [Bremerella cremea]|uniref:N-(5'-phosphoribosyl)anthranilate isomerase n=1 Tax=Bremerella cremea TaxID=1031537 RepID=A0A368KRW0_9BACT|nr:phosphoribosylanthranilate isomerase [Bremerella cremea]RCS50497.1 phosphoribosylanthranilate isomerase [Bremerella cremea]